jgi:hypothetical protein
MPLSSLSPHPPTIMAKETDAALLRVKTIKNILVNIDILTEQNYISDVMLFAEELNQTQGDLRELLILRDNLQRHIDEVVGG